VSNFQTKASPDKKTQETKGEPPQIGSSTYVAQRDKTRVVPKYLPPQPPPHLNDWKKGFTGAQMFTFQTFIPDKYLPGSGELGYGDNRGFGKPGDKHRTCQWMMVQTDEEINESGIVLPPAAHTGVSETKVPFLSDKVSTQGLSMSAKRKSARAVTVTFSGSIQNGARIVGSISPKIDFRGAVTIEKSTGAPNYRFHVTHDPFPAYEAFVNTLAIYRWSYPAGSTVADLIGSGTVQAVRKTGDASGGVIGASGGGIKATLKRLRDVAKRKIYPKGELYVVQPGDNLSKIALKFLGDESRHGEILAENFDVLEGKVDLTPGMKLVIHKPVDVHNLPQVGAAVQDPQAGLMRIKGEMLDYVEKHEETTKVRRDFKKALTERILGYLKSGSSVSSFADVYTKPTNYGGAMFSRRAMTKGFWLLGHCSPQVRYTVRWSGDAETGWTVSWAAIWVINDNLDFIDEPGHSAVYRKAAREFKPYWYDAAGGRLKAPIQAKWKEGGRLNIPPISPQTAARKSSQDTIRILPKTLAADKAGVAETGPAIAIRNLMKYEPWKLDAVWKVGGALGPSQIKEAMHFYEASAKQYSARKINRIRRKLGLPEGRNNSEFVQAVALYQRQAGLEGDGKAGAITLRHMFGADILSAKK